MDDKNLRKREIVIYAVDEYIRSAQPITSAQLNIHFNNISSATLRNELNALESMGYFRQIHTSGGRIPTALAYKEYVKEILTSDKLTISKMGKVLEDYEDKSISLISTMSALAKKLSKLTNCPTVLVQHGLRHLVIEKIQIIPLMQKDALLLVETNAGIIDDNLYLDPNIEKSAIVDAGEYLTRHFKGKTIEYMLDNIANVCMITSGQVIEFRNILNKVVEALTMAVKARCDVTNENPTRLLTGLNSQEFEDTKNVFEFLERKEDVIDAVKTNEELTYTVGDENETLKGGMMMSAPIKIDGVPIASLALLGPKRIDYSVVASALKYIMGRIDNKGDKSEKD